MEGHSLGHCLPEVLGPWQDLLPLPPKCMKKKYS